MKRESGRESSGNILEVIDLPKSSQKKGGKNGERTVERSIKVKHTAGHLIPTGNLQASGIMSHERAEKVS